jgi:hypothetical protein
MWFVVLTEHRAQNTEHWELETQGHKSTGTNKSTETQSQRTEHRDKILGHRAQAQAQEQKHRGKNTETQGWGTGHKA